MKNVLKLTLLMTALASSAPAQVALEPATIEPAGWERIALRVVNQQEAPIVRVSLDVPEILQVLGVDAPPEWSYEHAAPTDTTPQRITWSGDSLASGDYREFAFLGRLRGDARRRMLHLPVILIRSDGTSSSWGYSDSPASGPRITIVGGTRVTAWGSLALAGAAAGLAILALALAVSARRSGQGHSG